MASVTITNTVAKCFKNKATWRTMNWWKTSFNMPVPDIFEDNSVFTETEWMLDAQSAWTSFDLTWFQLWWEAIACNSVYAIYWPFSWGTVYIKQKWYNTQWALMFENWPYQNDIESLNSSQWTFVQIVSNQWVAEWEINKNWTYRVVAEISWAISWTKTTYITITWCPPMEQYQPWYVWVDWNDLCWTSANWHKHTMYWIYVSNTSATPWYIWIDWEHTYWTWTSWAVYRSKYNIRQFESTFSNWAPWVVSWKKPWYFYMDNEFWHEHISYIDAFWYKCLLNSWANPYYFGSEP